MSDEAEYNALPAELEEKMKAKRASVRAARASQSTEERPKGFGSYELTEPIGEGPTARVHRALDAQGDAVALKILRRAVVAGVETPGARAAAMRDRRESLLGLSHPHLLRVHDVLEEDGRTALILDPMDAATLIDHVRDDGALSFQRVAALGAAMASALRAVHDGDLVHNDVEPRNVWLSESGPVLAEISSACEFGEDRGDRAIALSGTPQFMAPELLRGASPTAQSDVYALAATMFFAATGRPPFKGPQLKQLREAHARGTVTSLGELREAFPSKLVAWIEGALAVEPAARPTDLEAAEHLLRECSELDPATARLESASAFQRWWASLPGALRAALLTALVAAFVLLLWSRGN